MFQTRHSSVSTTLSDQQLLTDVQLLRLCTQYGTQAKLWKQKFLGLLPEMERRKLYLQAGCSSLFEFAAKVGGVSREQVLLIFRLNKRFDQAPELKHALTSGEVSVHKLARVASVVNSNNQDFWLQKSKVLSQTALEVLVKDSKSMRTHASNPKKTEKIQQFDDLGLSSEMRGRLLNLRNKGIDINQLLGECLDQREEKIQQEKQRMAEELKRKETQRDQKNMAHVKPSRYIPQKVKAILQQQYGEKCSLETCTNKATNIHHTRRFGLNPSHNPLFLAPLCKQHHEIAHSLDIKAQEKRRGYERIVD